MRVSVLIPCHNEAVGIAACVSSCLNQTRPADEIVVVNNGSTDASADILRSFGDRIVHIEHPEPLGNKSYAQELGLRYVTGDIVVSTDGDTVLDRHFIERVLPHFEHDPALGAVAGYLRSVPFNWLTACRAFEYAIGQHIHKRAQHHIGLLFVIPGAAGVFRVSTLREQLSFDHDTVTEDLDFTYRLHTLEVPIYFVPDAVAYTQDPVTIHSYVNQMRRWYGGGWQCLLKHQNAVAYHPQLTFLLGMIYLEGMLFAFLFFVLPLIDIGLFAILLLIYLLILVILASIAAVIERRRDLLLIPVTYFAVVLMNTYVFVEQFCVEVVAAQRNRTWFQPRRFSGSSIHRTDRTRV